MKLYLQPLGALFAVAALLVAAPVWAQRDRYYDDRYEERYDERYERYERYDERTDHRDDDDRYSSYREYDYARVIDVNPIIDKQSQPVQREECRQEPLARRERTRDKAPAIKPGIVGAVLGQPSATGSNRTVAVAGASTGTAARTAPATTRRCTTRTEYVEKDFIRGYDVTYRYRGRTYYAVTARDPGERIRIELD